MKKTFKATALLLAVLTLLAAILPLASVSAATDYPELYVDELEFDRFGGTRVIYRSEIDDPSYTYGWSFISKSPSEEYTDFKISGNRVEVLGLPNNKEFLIILAIMDAQGILVFHGNYDADLSTTIDPNTLIATYDELIGKRGYPPAFSWRYTEKSWARYQLALTNFAKNDDASLSEFEDRRIELLAAYRGLEDRIPFLGFVYDFIEQIIGFLLKPELPAMPWNTPVQHTFQ
ncbi:MAG: hypothetical protein LBN05_03685 [Oscillospiraceae bacterium]|jgi:hypothetical protein|nr:hypothetical protein [Oscillospiraceae bacterium]